MKPNYSHTYQSCVYSMKRENAPWRVSGGCGNLVVLCRRHSTAVYGQGMAFPNPLQIREVGDHRGLLAAECQVDEVLDAGL